ncbi:DNA helicase-2/ATP-dependent DNA helicase PcrA [Anaerosolibacter carboniphilus]|uniref:DNA helicase-2/ATP-dependent DNA helicase PcrA n=1 Tax=Anaerosolibacter carboniphilus TaxID=1417629 RepID=A0A841KQL4_9FIRM|nr:UvrD-helicase domain-containing protein [Anaerosolibacter carboniphilus]MBB6214408.1 DNA helicase-2/ATP-dependent DNA helicase PcrA [Anaerosolibacter carboniphilus]
MDSYQQNLQEEQQYLSRTLDFIGHELDREIRTLQNRKDDLLSLRKEMWENTVHFSTDFERLTEISQYLAVLNGQTTSYGTIYKQIEKYKKMLDTPYFGRFDFIEKGEAGREKIYVGLHNVVDEESYDILVYDWRAPISSIFYQFELGEAAYQAPKGTIEGNVLLKRQYKIHHGKLDYFFDCSLKIDDEILQEVLCRHSSSKMRNIVETIQKEQNTIIRDTNNELLIVQGVAGSGKTSIALHRIAFLLYHGIREKLSSNNILIISPNEVFSKYISGVLPELGEENVEQLTFDVLGTKVSNGRFNIEKRMEQLEWLIGCPAVDLVEQRKKSIAFKESNIFVELLNRLLLYYERNHIVFEDVYYAGKVIETKNLLRNQFLHDKIGRPIAKRLKRMEGMILDRIHPLRKERMFKIEKLVQKMDGHEFEIKSFSRLLSMKKSSGLMKKIRSFTQVDYFQVYRTLFDQEGLLKKLAQGLELPVDIESIIQSTRENLERGHIQYEDCAPLLFLKLKIEGNDMFSEIKQVVVDEAQDYAPIQYAVFDLLFKDARFTILGDIHQSIHKEVDISLYDNINQIFHKRKAIHLFLNKSYRSSYEISGFSQKILNLQQECISFERHEGKPLVLKKDSLENMDDAVVEDIHRFMKEGQRTIAVICKTMEESRQLHSRLKTFLDISIIASKDEEIESGAMIIPGYMAKGLEFDAVIVYDVSDCRYATELDRKLLYIACTRALHRLVIYYKDTKSSFLPDSSYFLL